MLIVTGNSTRKITTRTFDQMPIPSQRMNSGANAIVGAAWRPEIHGCIACFERMLLAIPRPMATPSTLAIT